MIAYCVKYENVTLQDENQFSIRKASLFIKLHCCKLSITSTLVWRLGIWHMKSAYIPLADVSFGKLLLIVMHLITNIHL